jgi:uncharacterized protein
MRGNGLAQRLDPSRAYKPLDVGEAGVSASVDALGRLVAVSQGHEEHGVVTLSAIPRFPDDSRYRAGAVRRYRHRLSTRRAVAFGLRPLEGPSRSGLRPAWLLADAIPATSFAPGREPSVATFVPRPDDADGARGVIQLVLPGATVPPLIWGGALLLGRAAYPELTEAGPLPTIAGRPRTVVDGSEVVLHDRALGWAVALAGDLRSPSLVQPRPEGALVEGRLRTGGRVVALGLGADRPEALAAARHLAGVDPDAALQVQLERWRARWSDWPEKLGPLEPVVRRGLAYVLGCCTVPVGEAICLVTDHRILPLSWTRDAYFAAWALLAWHRAGGPRETTSVVRRHLDWLFAVAARPEAWWARSHLVGGQPKDRVFQLDQQLYPLLELADYIELTHDHSVLDRHAAEIERVLGAIEARRAPHAALYGSDENAADDPLELPYQTANQILAWRAFSRLDALGFGRGRLADLAEAIRRAVHEHQLVRDGDGSTVYAYATDLKGRATVYHDANDLPMALAAKWGFCEAHDPVWRVTMRGAFSPANPGFFGGQNGGLGSRHTPAPWALGNVQALLVGRATGDAELIASAQRALLAQATWDAALPEASHPRTARPISRHWFAWPGAVVGAAELEAASTRAPAA